MDIDNKVTTPLATLYSSRNCHLCQRVNLALQEKTIRFHNQIIDNEFPEELSEQAPYQETPVLKDRDLVLFFPNLIMEYLEERYPHPPLLPEIPTERAKVRMYIHQIDRDWSGHVSKLSAPRFSRPKVLRQLREELRERIISVAPIFSEQAYYMSDVMTLADCCVLPILWRLPVLGIEIPRTRQTRAMLDYFNRMQATQVFQNSLTAVERELMAQNPLITV
ncbi:MAG: glutathione S-transferase N-terminal domain-containing protein [Gammaproteobacteria bacterium]